MNIPYIFDVQRGSTVDGRGLRTTVFFKGCNLDCFWCHNPEGKKPFPELAFFARACLGCGSCRGACPGEEGAPCRACGECAALCPSAALRVYGKQYKIEELLDIILADEPFYEATGGGVTLSGGECMLYPDFVSALLQKCKEKGIHTAIDTAGSVPFSHFEQVLPYTDMFLYDIKCLSPSLHKQGTGFDNSLILENLERLRQTGKEILVRVPLIPSFNEKEKDEIEAFCRARGLSYELLPYHTLGEGKKAALSAFRERK
ncbi:MAG: glycyl-radical enzyme activating protein [Clostridia bacterium]|nr:glycyl-radical enzyme activating protein [Clostridia bacterium]